MIKQKALECYEKQKEIGLGYVIHFAEVDESHFKEDVYPDYVNIPDDLEITAEYLCEHPEMLDVEWYTSR